MIPISVAKLTPVDECTHFQEATDEDVEKALLKDLADDFLSEKELHYYLKLK